MILLIAVFLVGWAAAAILGTQAYFLGEQSKPIHARNWRSRSFDEIALAVTGSPTDFSQRVPGFESLDAYSSSLLPEA
jgi:hypothetical protein